MTAVLVCMLSMMVGTASAQKLSDLVSAPTTLPENHNPWNISVPVTDAILKNMAKPVAAQKAPTLADTSKAQEFTFLGQSFYAGYAFSYDNGDVINRTSKLTIDVEKVIFHAFFNYAAQSTEYNVCTDEDFEGVYDAEAKTITVTTSDQLENAVIVAHTYGGYYDIVLLGGTANEAGQFAPDGKIVFDVIGDFEQIKARNHVMLFSASGGRIAGATAGFRSFNLFKPNAEKATVVTMSDKVTFSKCYTGETVSKTFSVYNVGGKDASITLVAGEEPAFYITPKTANVPASGSAEFTVEFSPSAVGVVSSEVVISAEGQDDIVLGLEGNGLTMTDFSPVVKAGEMKITTGLDNPFTLEEIDGKTVAKSGGSDIRRATSDLFVKVNVPKGYKGKFSWKGVYSSEYYFNIGGIILDGNTLNYTTGQKEAEDFSGTIDKLAPGDHTIDIQYYNDNYVGSVYVYDLEFETEVLPADAAECPREVVSLGHHLQKNEDVIEGVIPIVNNGANRLYVKHVTCDNANFVIEHDEFYVTTFETLELPVTLNTNELGVHEGKATIETTAGNIEVTLRAGIYDPDYTKIVKEGSVPFEFHTFDWAYFVDRSPFIVNEDAAVPYAYNASAKDIDYDPLVSCLEARFEIPEGCYGHLSWEGKVSCSEAPDPSEWANYDYPCINVGLVFNPAWPGYTNNASFYIPGALDSYAGSDLYDINDDEHQYYYNNIFRFGEGSHTVYFCYYQLGDAKYDGEDCLKIYNLCVELVDPAGIDDVAESQEVASREYYNLTGAVVSNPHGIVIEKVTFKDGTIKSHKVVKK